MIFSIVCNVVTIGVILYLLHVMHRMLDAHVGLRDKYMRALQQLSECEIELYETKKRIPPND